MRFHNNFLTPLRGTLLTLAALCAAALAQSPLVTIQDTLFKADGTRFNGTVLIHWSTFDAANLGTVVQQSRSVSVTNGNLQVQLAPNAGSPAPANVYTVQYQGDGREQFTETWTVPVTTQPLKVADVRTGTFTSSSTSSAGNQTPIPEANVIGLVSDLGQRPVKGPGFGTGSVAVINPNGQIETVVGSIGDCVLVDGTTGPCGGPASTYFDAETPGGVVDGSNLTFTLANTPSGTSLMLFRNGLYMKAGSDYALTGATIQFTQGFAPQPLDTLIASYRIDPNGNIGAIRQGQGTQLAQVVCSATGFQTAVSASSSLGTCAIPANLLNKGDRFEVRFDYQHSGAASAFDVQVKWGTTQILSRHASAGETAVSGHAEASIGAAGAQIAVESYGGVLPFLAGIVSAAPQTGLTVDLRGQVNPPGTDRLTLTNFTVLRYPGN